MDKIRQLPLYLGVTLALIFGRQVQAAVNVTNPLGKISDVPSLVANIISAILGIVGALALLMFVWGGVTWMISGGNSEKVKKGKDTLIWATIGLLVIFASYSILKTIFGAFTQSS